MSGCFIIFKKVLGEQLSNHFFSKMKQKNVESFIEICFILLFLGFFIYQSYTIYQQYAEGKTSFAMNFQYSKTLDLPEVTVCPHLPDTPLRYNETMTEELYMHKYPDWQDMFYVRNTTVNITETRSYDKGRCWTLSYLNGSVPVIDLEYYFTVFMGDGSQKVSPVKKFNIYVHEPGEAFILSIGVYNYETISPMFVELGSADSGTYFDVRFTKRIRTLYQVEVKWIHRLKYEVSFLSQGTKRRTNPM